MGKLPKGEVTTYTDFGKVQGGMRTSYAYHKGQEAYDLYMGARYLQDMMFYNLGKIDIVFQPEDLRDNNRKYAGLLACKNNTNNLIYYEVGSSCLGVIDALEYLNKESKELDVTSIKFIGVDNSKWMRDTEIRVMRARNVSNWGNEKTMVTIRIKSEVKSTKDEWLDLPWYGPKHIRKFIRRENNGINKEVSSWVRLWGFNSDVYLERIELVRSDGGKYKVYLLLT